MLHVTLHVTVKLVSAWFWGTATTQHSTDDRSGPDGQRWQHRMLHSCNQLDQIDREWQWQHRMLHSCNQLDQMDREWQWQHRMLHSCNQLDQIDREWQWQHRMLHSCNQLDQIDREWQWQHRMLHSFNQCTKSLPARWTTAAIRGLNCGGV